MYDYAETLDCVCDVCAARCKLFFLASALNGNADILVVGSSIPAWFGVATAALRSDLSNRISLSLCF